MHDNKTRTTRWCVLNDESYAAPGWPILQLFQDPLRTYEAPFGTAVFSDDPGKTSLDGRSALVQVVAIQTHSCLQPQGIPGAQTGELDRGTEERRCEESSMSRRNGDLFESQRK
jgi:hypothetical protein